MSYEGEARSILYRLGDVEIASLPVLLRSVVACNDPYFLIGADSEIARTGFVLIKCC